YQPSPQRFLTRRRGDCGKRGYLLLLGHGRLRHRASQPDPATGARPAAGETGGVRLSHGQRVLALSRGGKPGGTPAVHHGPAGADGGKSTKRFEMEVVMASIMTKIAPAYREHASHARRSVARMERERSSEP